jgi:cell division protein ZipA
MEELRWILLGLGLLLIGGIWWRGTREPVRARAPADVREPAARAAAEERVESAVANDRVGADPDVEHFADAPPVREWGVSPFEPLSIKTADFDRVPILEEPFLDETPAVGPGLDVPTAPAPQPVPSPTGPSAKPAAAGRQKIVSLRICALGDAHWSGTKLAEALEMQGLAFGRYRVFHRNHVDGRSLFCVASLIEPGTFDPEAMAGQEFRGVTAFAVLPGPLEPVQTVEAMIATARRLAESLTGMVQDAKGMPLSPQRAAALREEVAHFQATRS